MKALLYTLAFVVVLLAASPAIAGGSFHSDPVKEVPAAVSSAHSAKYGSIKTAWRKNTWDDQGKQVTAFIAWLIKDKKAHRVAYTPEGHAYLTLVYLGGAPGLPKNIVEKVTAANPGYAITAAQRCELGGAMAYRVELRKGTTKMIKWTDSEGADVALSNIPTWAEEVAK